MENAHELTDCFVAFIDILGATKAIEKAPQASLNLVHKIYAETVEQFMEIFPPDEFSPRVKIFSDNIVIGVPCGTEEFWPTTFWRIIVICEAIQTKFILNGWLVRGGVARGDFYSDFLMVWGNGLVKAHAIENSIAIYPRIVVENELATNSYLLSTNQFNLRQDIDGLYYVDYVVFSNDNVESLSSQLSDYAELQITSYKNNPRVAQKWWWFANYVKEKKKPEYLVNIPSPPQKNESMSDH